MTFAAASGGLTAGVLLTFFGFGLRHGVDWDHIAAISDITQSQDDRRRGLVLATLYAAGHAAVVVLLGVIAILVGARVPPGLDAAMGRVVGITLVALGVYVLVSMARQGRDFRLRSRWMLVFAFVRRLHARAWRSGPAEVVEHDHPHDHGDAGHHAEVHHAEVNAASAVRPASPGQHAHRHRHFGAVPDDPFVDYGVVSATGVGMLHGVGAETPTQVLVLAAAAGVGGAAAGIPLLLVFVAGLVCSNTLVALGTTYGLRRESRPAVYAAVSAVVALASIAVGVLFLLGRDAAVPALFG